MHDPSRLVLDYDQYLGNFLIRFSSSRRMPGSSEFNAMDFGMRRNEGFIRGSIGSFIGNAFFVPGRIVWRHGSNERAQLCRYRWSSWT